MPKWTSEESRARRLANLSSPKAPEGYRPTKAMRFTLPTELANKLENMSKAERDRILIQALNNRPSQQ